MHQQANIACQQAERISTGMQKRVLNSLDWIKQQVKKSSPEGLITQHYKLNQEPGRGQRQVQQVRRAAKEGWIITLTCSTAAYKGESNLYLHM